LNTGNGILHGNREVPVKEELHADRVAEAVPRAEIRACALVDHAEGCARAGGIQANDRWALPDVGSIA
jgi:hypothetical protein